MDDQTGKDNNSTPNQSPDKQKITGSSDNLGGYKIKTLDDYLSKETVPPANQPPVPPPSPATPPEPIRGRMLPPDNRRTSKPLLIAIAALVVILLIALVVHRLEHKTTNKSGSTGSFTQTNVNDTNKALNNPLNTNQQLNSQIKYCTSSPLAADVAC